MYKIGCAEIWGGIRGNEVEAETSGVRACLFSSACGGREGGDIYYFSVCSSDLLTRIVVADVTGHGEIVANTSQWLYDTLKVRMDSADGSEVLADLNRLATEYGYKAITTAAIAGFFRKTGGLFFSYAGHYPVLVRPRSQSEWVPAELPDRKDAANLPLGVDADTPYDQSQVLLCPGDQLLIYSDGVIEAPSVAGGRFGEERLRSVLNGLPAADIIAIKRTVLGELEEHTGGTLTHDDVTFIVAEIR